MPNDPKFNSRRTLSGQARDAAIKRLKANHADEYDALYREEADARGLKPRSLPVEEKRRRLIAELEKLESKGMPPYAVPPGTEAHAVKIGDDL